MERIPTVLCGHCLFRSGKEILIILIRKIILRTGLAAQRLPIADFLQVVQPTGDSLVAIAVERIKIDACPSIHAAIALGAFQNRLYVRVLISVMVHGENWR